MIFDFLIESLLFGNSRKRQVLLRAISEPTFFEDQKWYWTEDLK